VVGGGGSGGGPSKRKLSTSLRMRRAEWARASGDPNGKVEQNKITRVLVP
jgi:hypothetical protein